MVLSHLSIRNYIKLYAILQTTGSNRMRGDDYESLRRTVGLIASAAERGAAPSWKDSPGTVLDGHTARGADSGSDGKHVFPALRSIQRQVQLMMGRLTAPSMHGLS